MSENIFVDGIRVFRPKKAPDFVKLNFLVEVPKFAKFVKEYSKDGELRFDLKVSKGGKPYLSLNTYKPQAKKSEEKPLEEMGF